MSLTDLGSYEVDRISFTTGGTNFATILVTANGVMQYSSTTVGGTVQLQNITNPVLAQDAATKYYVDSMSQGISWKNACMLYSSTSVNLASAPGLFDGVVPVTGARILINAQTNVIANGIYIWQTEGVPLTRASDFPAGGSLQPTTDGSLSYSATAVFVQQGTTYMDTAWVETYDVGFIGTTTVSFSQFSSAGGSAAGTAAGQIQYRGVSVGQFAASPDFTWTTATNTLNISTTTTASSLSMSNGLLTLSTSNASSSLVAVNGLTSTGTSNTINATSGAVIVSVPTGSGAQDSFIGQLFKIQPQTYTMNNNAISITTTFVFNSISSNALGSTTGTTTNTAINLFVGKPIAVTSQTITNPYSIWADGNVNVNGLLSATSLTVTAPSTLSNLTVTSLTVTGPTNLQGPTTIVGPLSVTSNSTFGTLSATSAVFGTLSVGTLVGGAAPPAKSVQFNDGLNNFAGTSEFTWTTATNTLVVGSSNGTVNVGGTLQTIAGATTSGIVSTSSGSFNLISAAGATVNMFNTTTTGSINLASTLSTGNINVGTRSTTGSVIIWSTQASSSQSTGALQVKGGVGVLLDVYATKFRAASDIKYKTNIKPIENALDLAEKIECYTYNWKKTFRGYTPELECGFVAQQLEEIGLGNFVGSDENGKSVSYDSFIPISIKGIKELHNRIKELEKRVGMGIAEPSHCSAPAQPLSTIPAQQPAQQPSVPYKISSGLKFKK